MHEVGFVSFGESSHGENWRFESTGLQSRTESVFVDVDARELKCEVKACRFLRAVAKHEPDKDPLGAEQSVYILKQVNHRTRPKTGAYKGRERQNGTDAGVRSLQGSCVPTKRSGLLKQ